jgi:hypothetical protein
VVIEKVECPKCGYWFKAGREIREHDSTCSRFTPKSPPRKKPEQVRFSGMFAQAYVEAVDREVER